MGAMTLNCPMCGASAASDSPKCAHCGARLATISCPACFGMMFLGAKFCSHCGAAALRQENDTSELQCPRCDQPLRNTLVGDVELQECPGCQGIWASAAAMTLIQNDRERQGAFVATGSGSPFSAEVTELEVKYIYCPVCGEFMNRINFARCSNVVVDVCKPHGTWLDRDELRRIVEFIRAGGLSLARQKQIAELEYQRRRLAAERDEAENAGGAYGPRDADSNAVGFIVDMLRRLTS